MRRKRRKRRHARRWRGNDRAGASAGLAVPRAGQAERSDLQSRLQVLLLPVEGGALPGQRFRMADESARDVHPPAARRPQPRSGGHRGVAGRRADADGPRRSSGARSRCVEQVSAPGRQAHRAHDSDQRHAARRRLVRASFAKHGSWSGCQHRRAARAARRVSGRQGRPADVRQGHARAARLLQQHGVEFNMLCTVHAATPSIRSRCIASSATSCGRTTSSSSRSSSA